MKRQFSSHSLLDYENNNVHSCEGKEEEENKKIVYNFKDGFHGGIPYRIIFKGKELKRIYSHKETITFNDLKKEENNIALIDSNCNLIMFKDDNNIILLIRDKNFPYIFDMYFIDTENYNIEKEDPYIIDKFGGLNSCDWKGYQFPRHMIKHPFKGEDRRDDLGIIINKDIYQNIFIYNNFIIYERDEYTGRRKTRQTDHSLTIYCDIKYDDFKKYNNKSILILLYIVEICNIFYLPDDILGLLFILFKTLFTINNYFDKNYVLTEIKNNNNTFHIFT